MGRMAVACAQGFVLDGECMMLSNCLELNATGRVGRTSVVGQRKRVAYMVMLGEDVESRCMSRKSGTREWKRGR